MTRSDLNIKNIDSIIFDFDGVILDSLDAKTENEIIEYIYSLRNNKTIIIVSHNEEILNKCDNVYKIDNGELSIKN